MVNRIKRIKPNLVDHSLLNKAVPVISVISVKTDPKIEISAYINWIGLAILFIFVYMMYLRYRNKDRTELEKQNTILGFNQYINENLHKNNIK